MQEETKKGTGRRYWLKLEPDFFQGKTIKRLRLSCGAEGVVIFQKIILKSLANGCVYRFEGLEETPEEEIALDIDESDLETIRRTWAFMVKHALAIPDEEEENAFFLPMAAEMSGSETSSAGRMRNKRERDRAQSDGEASQSDAKMSQRYDNKEEQNNNKSQSQSYSESYNYNSDSDSVRDEEAGSVSGGAASASSSLTASPAWASVEELRRICDKNKILITDEGLTAYLEERRAEGWRQSGDQIDNIVKALRGWLKYRKRYKAEPAADPAGEPGKKPGQADQEPEEKPKRKPKQAKKELTERLAAGDLDGLYCSDFTEEERENHEVFPPEDRINPTATTFFSYGCFPYRFYREWFAKDGEETPNGFLDAAREIINARSDSGIDQGAGKFLETEYEKVRDGAEAEKCQNFFHFLSLVYSEFGACDKLSDKARSILNEAAAGRPRFSWEILNALYHWRY